MIAEHAEPAVTLDARTPDIELARRVAARDEPVSFLMRRYNQTLYRTARGILRDDAGEDALESYLQALRAIKDFRGDSKLSTGWCACRQQLGRTAAQDRRSAQVISWRATSTCNCCWRPT
jgi:RNA polymerase sigma-70 factor (ECF subfamily)